MTVSLVAEAFFSLSLPLLWVFILWADFGTSLCQTHLNFSIWVVLRRHLCASHQDIFPRINCLKKWVDVKRKTKAINQKGSHATNLQDVLCRCARRPTAPARMMPVWHLRFSEGLAEHFVILWDIPVWRGVGEELNPAGHIVAQQFCWPVALSRTGCVSSPPSRRSLGALLSHSSIWLSFCRGEFQCSVRPLKIFQHSGLCGPIKIQGSCFGSLWCIKPSARTNEQTFHRSLEPQLLNYKKKISSLLLSQLWASWLVMW